MSKRRIVTLVCHIWKANLIPNHWTVNALRMVTAWQWIYSTSSDMLYSWNPIGGQYLSHSFYFIYNLEDHDYYLTESPSKQLLKVLVWDNVVSTGQRGLSQQLTSVHSTLKYFLNIFCTYVMFHPVLQILSQTIFDSIHAGSARLRLLKLL